MLMKKSFVYQIAFLLGLAIVAPLALLGRETGNVYGSELPDIRLMSMARDTVPPGVTPGETQQEVKPPEIKEVPKSRRKIKPAPVSAPIPVKPVIRPKVIKPKVIRPKVGLSL
ncbi:hypothetical protein [Chitinophaga japonensis]|uniref:Uncharacterized protein n=1 Tax=Chitinophaga japonensis TaxID=104662 RepID=A0A562TBH3_CHIJA|nr:hypothetical protein [Chitinophaga japonensis]TWI90937.1 hypothetical protein LX66_0298 [Chitinophaga japonensis]